jgi:hypothetical protein
MPQLTDNAKKIISHIGNWYIQENITYIRICGATEAPHLLPKYVPDRLVVGEIAYQIVLQGFNASLLKEAKKNIFIPYGFRIEHYFIKDLKHERKEATNHLELSSIGTI